MKIIDEKNPKAAELASEFLRDGKIVAFATDTVYGIASDASNTKAVEKLYRLKKRDEKKPIAIFLPNLSAAKKIFIFDEISEKIAKEFLPGALTLILETNNNSSSLLAANLNQNNDNSLGFRIVDSFFVKKIFEKFNGFLAVSSANLSNHEPAKSAVEVEKYFPELDLLVCGEFSSKMPSTVAKISKGKITIIRQGSVILNV
jgi:L-threonylcarbamoyladenylate synthase